MITPLEYFKKYRQGLPVIIEAADYPTAAHVFEAHGIQHGAWIGDIGAELEQTGCMSIWYDVQDASAAFKLLGYKAHITWSIDGKPSLPKNFITSGVLK